MTYVTDPINSNNNNASQPSNSNNKGGGGTVRTPTPTVAPALLFPGFSTSRRYSDSHQILMAKPTISVSLAEDDNGEDGSGAGTPGGMNRRRANSYTPLMSQPNNNGEDIVCSTGELMNLKCLSHSAVEMRAMQGHEFGPDLGSAARRGSMFHSTGNNNYANLQHQRSRSFDASTGKKSPGAKSNLFTGLLNRIKVGVGVSSSSPPEDNDVEGCSSSTSTSTHAPPTTPISTTVHMIDPSGSGCGPTITTLSPTPSTTPRIPSSADRSPAGETASATDGQRRGSGKGAIPWDNNTGYFLDASMLGLAIENHLKNGDNKGKRRATFCTLSESNSQFLPGQVGSTSGRNTLGPQTNRPRSASAYSVLPFLHSSGGGPVDPELVSRRRESIASVFPTSSKGLLPSGRRNSSFNSSGGGDGPEPNLSFYTHSKQDDVIVGSFIKTSMTSEFYTEGEVIMEEEQLDIENYDNQTPQNVKNFGSFKSKQESSFLEGIEFWSHKPAETIINLFSSATSSLRNSSGRNNERFSFSSHRGSVATINEEEEEAAIGGGIGGQNESQRTFCGYFRKVIMQIINSIFRS